jgi:hypothetical protein
VEIAGRGLRAERKGGAASHGWEDIVRLLIDNVNRGSRLLRITSGEGDNRSRPACATAEIGHGCFVGIR